MSKVLLITPFVPTNIGAGVNYTRQFIEDLSIDHKIDVVLFKTESVSTYEIPNKNVFLLKAYRISMMKKLFNASIFFLCFRYLQSNSIYLYCYILGD